MEAGKPPFRELSKEPEKVTVQIDRVYEEYENL